jgi:hypothetical protein
MPGLSYQRYTHCKNKYCVLQAQELKIGHLQRNLYVSVTVISWLDWAYKSSTCDVMSTAPPLILWWSNLEILFDPLHRSSPFIGELRCQAIQKEHGLYIVERRFCYVIFNSHMFNAPRFNSEKDVSFNFFFTFKCYHNNNGCTVDKSVELRWVVWGVAEPNPKSSLYCEMSIFQ